MNQDLVNHPSHYTAGRIEVIDFIEDCVKQAPDAVVGGLQWQVLKYLSACGLRMIRHWMPVKLASISTA
jgi:hypothetical protein